MDASDGLRCSSIITDSRMVMNSWKMILAADAL
jgi:hypothetical protein